MTVRVVTDSTCDLPSDLVREHGITVVPAFINIGERSYRDGIDLSREEFYRALPGLKEPPTTAAPAVGAFAAVYERLTAEGASGIISVHVASSLSGIVNAARLGAEAAPAAIVHLVDSGQLSMGLGWLAVVAARAAAAGQAAVDIVGLLEAARPRTRVYALLDTLEFLRRSGRVNWAQFGLGTLLSIKPIIHCYEGVVGLERVRTWRRATERLLAEFDALLPVAELAVLHTDAREAAEGFRDLLSSRRPDAPTPPILEVTPAIGTHIGPGAVGFACIQAT